MSLIDDLLAEAKQKAMVSLPQKKELEVVNNVTIIIENPENDSIKDIISRTGVISKVLNPSGLTYCNNIRNKKIATVLSKFGNPEI